MAATFAVTVNRVRSMGDVKEITYTIAVSGTATDNGDALTFAQLGLTHCEYADCGPAVDSPITSAFLPFYDIANQKIVFLAMGGVASAATPLSEITAATSVASRTFKMVVHGKGSAAGPSM